MAADFAREAGTAGRLWCADGRPAGAGDAAGARRAGLHDALPAPGADHGNRLEGPVELHPSAARYREQVADIQIELAKGDRFTLEAVAFVRGLICAIKMTPEPIRWNLQVVGDLAILLELERGGNAADFLSGCGGTLRPRIEMQVLEVRGRCRHHHLLISQQTQRVRPGATPSEGRCDTFTFRLCPACSSFIAPLASRFC